MSAALVLTPTANIPSMRGSTDWFTGSAWIEELIDAPPPARIKGVWVTFEPGARTAWHTHPLGQTLFVTSGLGRVQVWGEPLKEILPGDAIWIAPDVKHWHGASPLRAMCHLALQEHMNGNHIFFHEHVSDDQYYKETEIRT